MLKAKLTDKEGKPVFLVGLSDRNLEKLKQDQPIMFDLETIQGEGTLFIFSAPTEADMIQQLRGHGFKFPDPA